MRKFKDSKIAVAGTGYVGLSIATLLSQYHQVMAVDIIPETVSYTHLDVYKRQMLNCVKRSHMNASFFCKKSP